jgi:pimeloyl-ACP methyl ester carboxylesterase
MPAGVGFTDTAIVADVLDTVRHQADASGSPVALLGHSLGASTAAGLAAAAPELVRALVLEDPPWQVPLTKDGDGPADRAAEQLNPHRPWLEGLARTDHEGRRAWVADHHPQWPADEWDPWAHAKVAVDLALFDASQRWLRRRWRTLVGQIHCPVLLLVGDPEHDTACEPDVSAELATLSGWSVVEVRGAGHNVRRDRRDDVAALVRSFLAVEAWAARNPRGHG